MGPDLVKRDEAEGGIIPPSKRLRSSSMSFRLRRLNKRERHGGGIHATPAKLRTPLWWVQNSRF